MLAATAAVTAVCTRCRRLVALPHSGRQLLAVAAAAVASNASSTSSSSSRHRSFHSLPEELRPRFDAHLGRLADEFDALSARVSGGGNCVSPDDAARWSRLKPLADKIVDLRLLRDLSLETGRMIDALTGGEGDGEAGEVDGEVELVDMARLENQERQEAIQALEVDIARQLLPTRPLPSDCPVLLEVRPGVGGIEAMLFAAELFQMYVTYAAYRGWACHVVEEATADLGGLRSGAMEISNGEGIFEELKYETGAHRVQRVPQTGDVIHTSTATVFVMPKPEDLAADFELNPADVEIQLHKSSAPGGQSVNKLQSAVRLVHRPTGLRVDSQSERSQARNMELGRQMLRERVLRRKLEALADEERQARAVQEQRDRSDRIRTYNYQQGRVTDHRVRLSHSSDVATFMAQGQHLQGFIGALRDREAAAELARTLAEAEAAAAAAEAGRQQKQQELSDKARRS